jgi:hypothetical protein
MRVMNIGDPPSAAVGQAGDHWVEVTEPLADVMHLLSGQILQEPTSLTGASIAVTEQGTLILNALAWALFAESLKALPGLRTRVVAACEMKPVHFLLSSGF